MVCVELSPICSNARKEEEHMKKRGWLALAMILILAAAMAVLPAMAEGETAVYKSGDYQYILLADGTAEITNCASEAASLPVPDQLDGYTVTSIGRWAFAGCRFLTSITLPDRLTSIGEHAFDSCRFLTSITFPDGLTSIGDEAFAACKSLASITLPNGLTSIGEGAFKDCFSLTSVILPDSLTSIGDSAFFQCQSLASITFPNSLTSIGGLAFYGCSSLTSVTLPDSLTTIGENPFICCDQLAQIQVSPDHPALAVIDGALFSKAEKALISYPCALMQESYAVPGGITSIGNYAFYNCNFLTSITLPDGLTGIGEQAFGSCKSLVNIVIPDSVSTIGDWAFTECCSLMSVVLPDSLTSIGKETFSWCESLTSISLPDSVTSIGYRAFIGCDSLAGITFPSSLTSIDGLAFYNCSSLTSVTLPDGLTSIGEKAFSDCSSLTSITLPDGLTSIEEQAFSNCKSLTSITLPDGLTSIGTWMFSGCESLSGITLPGSLTHIGCEVFENCKSLTSIMLPDSLTDIEDNPFIGCDKLTRIQVSPDHPTLAVINGVLFSKAEKELICYPCALTQESYTVPNGVTSIGHDAFKGCRFLKSITLPDSPIHIEENPFTDCDELMRIHVSYDHPTLASINGVLFSKPENELICYPCAYKQEIYSVPKGTTSIGRDAFKGCRFLKIITLPDSLVNIEENPFTDCDELTKILVSPDHPTLAAINGVLFSKAEKELISYPCASVQESYTVPDGITSIGCDAFYNCRFLTNITLPDSLTGIGEGAFTFCANKLTFAVGRGSWAANWCHKNRKEYTYPDSLDWLHN